MCESKFLVTKTMSYVDRCISGVYIIRIYKIKISAVTMLLLKIPEMLMPKPNTSKYIFLYNAEVSNTKV